uniref:Putative reductase VP1231 n=1 Tax=Anthurium amnicola TaxID=1678845 RepID=A0A1D1Z4L9_9ARAE
METRTPAIIQNENLHIPQGKGIEGVKVDLLKPEKKERKERKALADLSKPAKPVVSAALKGSALKAKSSLRNETTRKAPKSSILTDEEIKKCHEWAKEGIEKVHFTGNDIRKHEKDVMEKRVKKKVDMVMSSMGEWNQVLYNYVMPVKKVPEDIEDIKSLELEPEVLLSVTSCLPTSGVDGEDLFPEEPEIEWPFDKCRFELKLKEDCEADVPF